MGVLLGIYAGTTISAFLMDLITSKAMDERLDREGYTYNEIDKKGPAEKIREGILTGAILLIPGINFILGCAMFFGYNKLYKSTLEDGLTDGTIRRKTEEEKEEQRIKQLNKGKKSKKIEVVKEEIVINKPYSEMTNEEKLAVLEKEKAFLLSINNRQDTKSYNDKGAYTKK